MFDKRTDLRGKVVACHRIIGSERIHLRDGQLYHVQDERDERRGKKPPILCKKREKFRKLLFQNRCAAHGLQSDFSPRRTGFFRRQRRRFGLFRIRLCALHGLRCRIHTLILSFFPYLVNPIRLFSHIISRIFRIGGRKKAEPFSVPPIFSTIRIFSQRNI